MALPLPPAAATAFVARPIIPRASIISERGLVLPPPLLLLMGNERHSVANND
jgi:hypothetical protein